MAVIHLLGCFVLLSAVAQTMASRQNAYTYRYAGWVRCKGENVVQDNVTTDNCDKVRRSDPKPIGVKATLMHGKENGDDLRPMGDCLRKVSASSRCDDPPPSDPTWPYQSVLDGSQRSKPGGYLCNDNRFIWRYQGRPPMNYAFLQGTQVPDSGLFSGDRYPFVKFERVKCGDVNGDVVIKLPWDDEPPCSSTTTGVNIGILYVCTNFVFELSTGTYGRPKSDDKGKYGKSVYPFSAIGVGGDCKGKKAKAAKEAKEAAKEEAKEKEE